MSYSGQRGGSRGSRHGGRAGGPRLPSNLMDEVEARYGGSKKARLSPGTRKEMRKAARHPGRAPQPQRAPQQQTLPAREPARPLRQVEEDVSVERTRPQRPESIASTSKRRLDAGPPAPIKKKRKEITLPDQMDSDVEDAEIEWLEYMLKKDKKGKSKATEEEDGLEDGLDGLLDLADLVGPGGRGLKRDRSDSDLGNSDELGIDDDSGEESEDDDDRVEDEDEDDDDGGGKLPPGSEDDVEDDAEDMDDTEDEEMSGKPAAAAPHTASVTHSVVEQEVAPATRYIPPHLRAAQLEAKAKTDVVKAEELKRLERKAQGLLNKLSEANIDSILSELEELFRSHSRHDVTTTLTNLIIVTISSRSNLLASFVTLYATLVASLHRIIGTEFAGHFIHTLVMRYRSVASSNDPAIRLETTLYETPDEGKEGLNLLTLLAELYNVGVIGPGLLYDLIKGFLAEAHEGDVLSEKGTEALLKIIRTCGPQLRHDDPASLKDIVGLISERTKGKEKDMTARARYMIETLTNLKNGKLKATPGADLDAANRMKKYLNSLGRKRRLITTEPLRVSLNDLLSADSRGKWWLVGAGWSGNPLAELEASKTNTVTAKQSADKGHKGKGKEKEEVLLELARQQGMNTDVRRGIFVILMTSEDYMHALERMSAMKLTEVQQRECIRVAVHCASLEKRYNPYYTLLLNHLCTNSHSHRFTFQYALWDFLRTLGDGDLGKEGKGRAENLAKTLAYMIGRHTLDLTVLKAVEFPPPSATRAFLYALLTSLMIATQTPSPLLRLPQSFRPSALDAEAIEEVFDKCLVNHDLASGLRFAMEGLRGKEGEGVEGELVKAGLKLAKQVLGKVI